MSFSVKNRRYYYIFLPLISTLSLKIVEFVTCEKKHKQYKHLYVRVVKIWWRICLWNGPKDYEKVGTPMSPLWS